MAKATFSGQYFRQATWLVNIRWFVALALLLAVLIVHTTKLIDLQTKSLLIVALSIFVINGIYFLHLKKNEDIDRDLRRKDVIFNINTQIFIDFVILTFLIHFSGGIENPMLIFYVFHMIIGSIILSRRTAFLQAFLAIGLLSTLTLFEYFEVIPHYPITACNNILTKSNPIYLLFSLFIFSSASLLVVYFTSTLALRLRNIQIELKGLNNELLRKDEIKNEYVQRVTHNIKGDLTTINSCLAVVKEKTKSSPDSSYDDFVFKAYNRTIKLMEFVDDLLKLTNMRLSNRFETTRFNLSEVIEEIMSHLQTYIENKGISVNIKMPDKPVYFRGVKVSIFEAFYNLIHNAVKYTPNNGEVNVILKKGKGKVSLVVSDNGMGIPEEDLPNVFNEFYRAQNVKEKEGTGLGLSLVQAIVSRHNGEVSVTSEINKGTTFKVVFDCKTDYSKSKKLI